MMQIRFWIFSSLLFLTNLAAANDCLENRGAMDFGSGTTKSLVVQVDVCERKVLKIIFEDRLPLALNEALEKSPNKTLPLEVVQGAEEALKSMVAKVRSYQVKEIRAVATSVFRVARNGQAVLDQLAKKLGIKIELISQEKEAELGYWSALAQKNLSPSEKIIVWDIGGGSMQMYARAGNSRHIFEGDLASVTFKNKILEIIKFQNPQQTASPNPIGAGKEAAVQIAKNHAVLNVPTYFKIHGTEARWIGVGGVLSMSVQYQTNPQGKAFNRENLEKTYGERVFLKDSEIKSEYRISDVSNLALVLGYMKALNISEVETVKSSLGEGLLYRELHTTTKSLE